MNHDDSIESLVAEYTAMLATGLPDGALTSEGVAIALQRDHEWTRDGALAIVHLANDYGAFMLRNAQALAIALGKEDGDAGY